MLTARHESELFLGERRGGRVPVPQQMEVRGDGHWTWLLISAVTCHPYSAANVKKWEIELQTLRESNARLTTALQESAASVEQWKRQFSICRDENDRLRSKVGFSGTGGLASRSGSRRRVTEGPWPLSSFASLSLCALTPWAGEDIFTFSLNIFLS